MSTYGAVVIGRNDNYGDNLISRTSYSVNSLLDSLDEVIYIDWGTEKGKLPLPELLDIPKTGKFSYIVISQEWIAKNTPNDPEQQTVCEVLARNIGLRRLKTDFLISTNPDIIAPERKALETYYTATDAFITTPKRTISLYTLWDKTRDPKEIGTVRNVLND